MVGPRVTERGPTVSDGVVIFDLGQLGQGWSARSPMYLINFVREETPIGRYRSMWGNERASRARGDGARYRLAQNFH